MLRVLVIDDDRELCQLVSVCLLREGMSVQVAHDGRSGLNLARSGQHDLAILDVMLPELTGLQGEATAKQLHHRRFDADRPW